MTRKHQNGFHLLLIKYLPDAPASVQRPPSTQKPLESRNGPHKVPPATHPILVLQNLELASHIHPRHSCVAASPEAPLRGSWHTVAASNMVT